MTTTEAFATFLTACDRTPEIGDTLRYKGRSLEHPGMLARCVAIDWDAWKWEALSYPETGWAYYADGGDWIYAQRADGGAIQRGAQTHAEDDLGPLMPCGHHAIEQHEDESGTFCGGCEPFRLPPVSEESVQEALRRLRQTRERKRGKH